MRRKNKASWKGNYQSTNEVYSSEFRVNLVKDLLSDILQPRAYREEGRQLASAWCGSSRWGVRGHSDL